MDLRDLVLWIVGALLAYLAWLLIRLLVSFRKKRPFSLGEASEAERSEARSHVLSSSLGKAYSSDVFDGDEESQDDLPVVRLDDSDRRIHVPPEPDAGRFGFDALLEIRTTRHLVDELQRQCSAMQTEMEGMRRELADLRASAQVSPFYGEAVALARRGYDAQAIAERCEISVAEAEMVCSLSKTADKEE